MHDYQPPSALLRDRVILVTGSGAGIGRAVALAAAAHGATVVLLGRTIRKLEQLYDEIEQGGHPQPAIYPMNLEGSTPKDYAELAERLGEAFGRLDGLVHNAAILEALTPIRQYDPALWYRIMQVNLNAPFLLTQAVLDLLDRAADASVVFTTDRVADEGRAYWGAYAAAKGGLQTLTRVLAHELEANTAIRVNALDPGPVHTALRLKAYPAADTGQWARPEAAVNAYLYLLGPDSREVTGQLIRAQD
ncbi:MAG: YciK family oxidoreductase [Candidatus Competibacterales bacterium]|nr:YciK family oxidoreductase [Candidatus Competibacterales bacterium]